MQGELVICLQTPPRGCFWGIHCTPLVNPQAIWKSWIIRLGSCLARTNTLIVPGETASNNAAGELLLGPSRTCASADPVSLSPSWKGFHSALLVLHILLLNQSLAWVHLRRPGLCFYPAAKEFGKRSLWLLPGEMEL